MPANRAIEARRARWAAILPPLPSEARNMLLPRVLTVSFGDNGNARGLTTGGFIRIRSGGTSFRRCLGMAG